jgi:structural maintenance of chromosome 2
MSRRELGELEKRWKAVEREAGQGERDIKKMQVEVEALRKKADSTGWNEEKEHASVEALRNAKNDTNRCTQVLAPSYLSQVAYSMRWWVT